MTDEDKTPEQLTDQLMPSDELELRNERIKAIGELAGGVAHNFNNLLQIITGGCEVALQALEDGNLREVRNTIEELLECAASGARGDGKTPPRFRIYMRDDTRILTGRSGL